MKVAIAQINVTVGSLKANTDKAIQYIKDAYDLGADIVLLPESTIPGYLTLDLLFNRQFIKDNLNELDRLTAECPDIIAIVGYVQEINGKLFNAAGVIQNGKLIGKVFKNKLPTYDVFNENRYYVSGDKQIPVKVIVDDININAGVQICEDMWDTSENNITSTLVSNNADIILNISASPYVEGKLSERIKLITDHSKNTGKAFVYCNLVGGQDEIIFDGASLATDTNGNLIHISPSFKENLSIVDFNLDNTPALTYSSDDHTEDSFNAIQLGIHDYILKSGFNSAILGMSGGIDSALVAVIASEAIGPEYLTGVSMPSQFSSDHSKSDAEELSNNLGIHFRQIPIKSTYDNYLNILKPHFNGAESDETEENIQARIRGNILMALSNKFNHLLLSTGNKTELALGYATMYGDMAGGLAPINDVSKLQVYKLCRYYNELKGSPIIPESVFDKTPSAELSEGQVDPFDYEIISPLVDDIIQLGLAKDELLDKGYDADTIEQIIKMIKSSEFKRRQSPPGIKITNKAFGIGRRMPLINHYKGL